MIDSMWCVYVRRFQSSIDIRGSVYADPCNHFFFKSQNRDSNTIYSIMCEKINKIYGEYSGDITIGKHASEKIDDIVRGRSEFTGAAIGILEQSKDALYHIFIEKQNL